nr:putative AC transposase [Tanacetum cinerariifolium]
MVRSGLGRSGPGRSSVRSSPTRHNLRVFGKIGPDRTDRTEDRIDTRPQTKPKYVQSGFPVRESSVSFFQRKVDKLPPSGSRLSSYLRKQEVQRDESKGDYVVYAFSSKALPDYSSWAENVEPFTTICGDHGSGFIPRRLPLRVACNPGRAITSKKTFSEPVQLSQISHIPETASSGPAIHNSERHKGIGVGKKGAQKGQIMAELRSRKEAEREDKAWHMVYKNVTGLEYDYLDYFNISPMDEATCMSVVRPNSRGEALNESVARNTKFNSNSTLKNHISHPHGEALKRSAKPGRSSMSRDESLFVYNLDVLRKQFTGLVIQRGLSFNHFDDEQTTRVFQKYLQPKYNHAKETMFPVLSRMAMDILSVQATSVASESVFSTSERVLSIRRTRLSPASLKMSMCLKDHLDAQERKQDKSTLKTPVDFEEEIMDAKVQANEAIPLSDEEIALDAASSDGSMSGPGSEGEEAEAEANYGYDVYHDDY